MPPVALASELLLRSTEGATRATFSLEQAAEFLDVPVEFVSELTHIGGLPYRLVRGDRRVSESDLIAYKREFERMLKEERESSLSRVWELPVFHDTFFLREIPETR